MEAKGDTLFSFIEALQGTAPWDTVLDAGTGKLSLEWILSLPTRSWTAVTGSERFAGKVREEYAARMRPADRVVLGNWSDPLLLHGEVYRVVVADYLLGAIDGFAPYFQERLFARLKPHVGSRLYVVGLEPYPDPTEHPWGQVILELTRLRDACILIAGHRTYREYPLAWVLRSLEASGYSIEEAKSFPIRYGERFVEECLSVCRQKLPYFRDRKLAGAMEKTIARLRDRALSACRAQGGSAFGADYVVAARPLP